MDSFFSILKKFIVLNVFVAFFIVATYTPQVWQDRLDLEIVPSVSKAHAQWADGAILASLQSLVQKEFVLDPIVWGIVKALISSMVNDLTDWIRSGFQGKPHFVTNIRSWLLEVGDQVVGEYIAKKVGTFVCSPFRLDIQIALTLEYEDIMRSRGEQPVRSCNLSDITGNIEDFLSGSGEAFTSDDGWKNWFTITREPMVYTPYGAYLSAEAGMRASILNAEGEEVKLLEFGDGFLSAKICEGESLNDCIITKPGKIIEEALTLHLDTGRQTLVSADEISELIGAFVGYLADRVLTSASGLLAS